MGFPTNRTGTSAASFNPATTLVWAILWPRISRGSFKASEKGESMSDTDLCYMDAAEAAWGLTEIS